MKYLILLLIILPSLVFSQKIDSKEHYKDIVEDSSITWAYQSRLKVKLPAIMEGFVEKLFEEALNGKVIVKRNESVHPLTSSDLSKMLNSIDTIVRIDPVNLIEEEIYQEYDYTPQKNNMYIYEVWFLEDFKLKSRVELIAPIFDVLSGGESNGITTLVYKEVEDFSTNNKESIVVERKIYTDSTYHYNSTIKMLYNEGLAEIVWNNLDEFTILDKDGEILENNQNVIETGNAIPIINPLTLKTENVSQICQLSPNEVYAFLVEEEIFVDDSGFNIVKKIKKMSPILKNCYNTKCEYTTEEFIPFTIVFD